MRIYTVMYSGLAWASCSSARSFPAIVLWCLTRPAVKSACSGTLQDAEGAEPAVLNLAGLLVGPLAGPECRRAVARGWLILVRGLAAVAVFGVVVLALWVWWINQQLDPIITGPLTSSGSAWRWSRGCSSRSRWCSRPAVLAGSLAGERERGRWRCC